MTKNTILPQELNPRLIPLEYCTIERAARMLKIEIDDIKHFNETGYIALYTKTEEITEGLYCDEEYDEEIPNQIYRARFYIHFVAEQRSDSELTPAHIYIKYAGLKAIYDAIYDNKPLSKFPIKNHRIESKQSDLIFALIQSIQELKGCFNKNKVKGAQDLIDTYLTNRGVNEQINLDVRTIQGWRESSKLFYHDEFPLYSKKK